MPVSVITLQETWANNETEMNYLHLPNYTMVYDDSHLSKHGGLITYIHDTFSFERLRTVPRKWDFRYGTSSCITYFKLREHLILIK